MKAVHITLAAIALAASSATFAVEAVRFEAPTTSNVSRSEVQAEARRAAAAGKLRTDDAYPRFTPPAASNVSRADVQNKATLALGNSVYGEMSFDSNFIGGM